MKNAYDIFINAFRRSKKVILAALISGIMLIVLFNALSGMVDTSTLSGGTINIGLVTEETNIISADLRRYLTEDLGMQISDETDPFELSYKMVDRRLSAIVTLPAGYQKDLLAGNTPTLNYSILSDYENGAFISIYLQNYAQNLHILAAGANGDETVFAELLNKSREQAAIITETVNDQPINYSVVFGQTIGFATMVLFVLAFGTSYQLYDDRVRGVYTRIRATGVRAIEYLLGMCSLAFIECVVMLLPIMLYVLILGIDIGSALWQTIVLLLLFILVVVGFLLIIGLFSGSVAAIASLTSIIVTITCMLGGSFFPLEYVPAFMREAGKITPQYWLNTAISSLQTDTDFNWALNAGILLLFAAVLFILSGVKFVGRHHRHKKIVVRE
jgi:ABC-2 type transport system permease protein